MNHLELGPPPTRLQFTYRVIFLSPLPLGWNSQELHYWPRAGGEDLRPGLRDQPIAVCYRLRATGGHRPSITANAAALDVLGECLDGQVHVQERRVVVRRDAVGDSDVRPRAAVRGPERREGL